MFSPKTFQSFQAWRCCLERSLQSYSSLLRSVAQPEAPPKGGEVGVRTVGRKGGSPRSPLPKAASQGGASPLDPLPKVRHPAKAPRGARRAPRGRPWRGWVEVGSGSPRGIPAASSSPGVRTSSSCRVGSAGLCSCCSLWALFMVCLHAAAETTEAPSWLAGRPRLSKSLSNTPRLDLRSC